MTDGTDERENQSIKYRLIGALVIIFSFTLAWLLLLDHDVKRQSQWAQNVPAPIEIERFDVERPELAVTPELSLDENISEVSEIGPPAVQKIDPPQKKLVEKSKPQEFVKKTLVKPVEPVKKKVPIKTKQKAKPQTYTQLNKKGLPDAWIVQIASFKDKNNAKKLQQDLLRHDFPAYVKTFNISSGRIYRVLIGPKMDKTRASAMGKRVKQKIGIKTLLVAYKPGFEE
ncbi:MAG: SPOR domain-containing protein [Pseudomonadales bacterium]|nr:SPOR domain-containing protein [Pseudomonadales bacterium]